MGKGDVVLSVGAVSGLKLVHDQNIPKRKAITVHIWPIETPGELKRDKETGK